MQLTKRFLNVGLGAALLLGPLAGFAAAQQQQACTILRFAGPNRFSPTNVSTLEDLQKMFVDRRGEIEGLLRQAGWGGNAADLFSAVAAGQGITGGSYEKGTQLQWMMVRKAGQPALVEDRCWGGARPFEAWILNIESNGRRWNFAVPLVCGNVALLGSQELTKPPAPPPPPPPKPPAPPPPPPRLTCSVSVSAASVGAREEVTVRVSATPQDRARAVKLEAIYEGAAVVSETLSSPYAWTGSFKKAGSYTVRAVAEGEGDPSDACTAQLEVTRPDSRWVMRFFGALGDDQDQKVFIETTRRPLPPSIGTYEQQEFQLLKGWGAGASAEYVGFRKPWLGIEFGGMYLDYETHWMYDNDFVWRMDEDSLTSWVLSVAPNFHLTPDSRADLYVGPILGYAFNEGPSFDDELGAETEYDVDDEFTFGAQVGLDWPVCTSGRCWTLSTSLKYLSISPDVVAPTAFGGVTFDSGLDPLIFTLGAGYRW